MGVAGPLTLNQDRASHLWMLSKPFEGQDGLGGTRGNSVRPRKGPSPKGASSVKGQFRISCRDRQLLDGDSAGLSVTADFEETGKDGISLKTGDMFRQKPVDQDLRRDRPEDGTFTNSISDWSERNVGLSVVSSGFPGPFFDLVSLPPLSTNSRQSTTLISPPNTAGPSATQGKALHSAIQVLGSPFGKRQSLVAD
jgi:hypothetical protein